jgi:hypothetical protein
MQFDNFKHEVWESPEGMTTLCNIEDNGYDYRINIEPNSKLIFSFEAYSHFDAMTKYYDFMKWGEYKTEFEVDKKPYGKKSYSVINGFK